MVLNIGFDENGKIVVNTDDGKKRVVREHKGRSLIEFPVNYVVVDIETTGFDPKYDSIIEVSAVRYMDGNEVESFSELIRPSSYYELGEDGIEDTADYCIVDGRNIQYVDNYISELTGISNIMLENAREEAVVLHDFRKFIGEDIIIGHNVNFDINFLYDAFLAHFNEPLINDFVDTMRLARRLLKVLKHHRLVDLAEFYNISYDGAHRALVDCYITYQLFQAIKDNVEKQYDSIEKFTKIHHSSDVKDITTQNTEIDEGHPLFGKVCVFTGTLEKMLRKEAMQVVADLGGINGNSVTAKTNYLILGNNDYCPLIKGGKSNKQKKAVELKLKGIDIEIISENVFYDMIESN